LIGRKYCIRATEGRILDNVSGPARKEPTDNGVAADHVDPVMRAARVLLAVVAQSVAEVEDIVTSPQLRVLVLISSRGRADRAQRRPA